MPDKTLSGCMTGGVNMMELMKLTERVYYLPYDPEKGRPLLGYVVGQDYSMAIDAGYSRSHVNDFYNAIQKCGFRKPDFTVLTHWHYAHTLGLRAISGVSVAHEKTNAYLKEEQKKAKNENYIDILKKEDAYFAKEYENSNKLEIELPDMEFTKDFQLDLGDAEVYIFRSVSTHTDDAVCIYISTEKVLFLGDATSEDYYNDGYMDREELSAVIHMIEKIDCKYCILSHCEPWEKEELLPYLYHKLENPIFTSNNTAIKK